MGHKLEVVFVQGTAVLSKVISTVSKKLAKETVGNFSPSHVLLVLDNKIVFESSTYKHGEDRKKVYENGTRILLLQDIDNKHDKSLIKRCTISDNCDAYLALKYVAKASNYHYSYGSIAKFAMSGHLRKQGDKANQTYICSGLVLDALREPIFDNNAALRKITTKFSGLDSNSVTPLDLFLAFCEAGYNFKESRGYLC